MPKPRIKIIKDGPYLVTGLPLSEYIIESNEKGESVGWKKERNFEVAETYALCRCGHSKNKPFCDGTHLTIDFDGTETAKRDEFFKCCRTIEGPVYDLKDNADLCAEARFCDTCGGTWNLVKETDDSKKAEIFLGQCRNCPSGRFVAWDKEKDEAIEPVFEPEIAIVQDPAFDCSGPIWVRGGVEIESADGEVYEVRNRVTLCRCGHSNNKPFCDGSHLGIKFKDNL
jgi:CDGSH-type Zn-finger protein